MPKDAEKFEDPNPVKSGFKVDSGGKPLHVVHWNAERGRPEGCVFPDKFEQILKAMNAPIGERGMPAFKSDNEYGIENVKRKSKSN